VTVSATVAKSRQESCNIAQGISLWKKKNKTTKNSKKLA